MVIFPKRKVVIGPPSARFFPKKESDHQIIDHINRTLKLFELYQHLVSLLRKMQNTFLKPVVKRFWLMGIFSQKGKTVDHINRTLNTFKLHQYLLSLLRNSQNTIFVKLFLKVAFLGSICLVCI